MEFIEEEVVFEGNPLADFSECGMEDTLEKIMSVTQQDKTSIPEYIKRKAGSIINLVQWVVNPPTFKNNCGIIEVIDRIAKFNLMDVDDLAIIKNYSSDASLQVPHKWSLIPKAVLEMTLVSVPSFILKMIPKMKTRGKYLSMLAFLLFIYRWYPVFNDNVDLKSMKKLLDLTAEFDRKTKKALNQIMNHNTFNQDYLMTRESHQIWNLEEGEIKELSMRSRSVLPGLRVALQSSTRRVTVAFSQATCKLRAERPLPAYLDAEPFYLPDVDDDDSMWFKLKDGEEEVSIPTIRILKSTVDILQLKRSEFFQRLVLGAIMDYEQYMGFNGSYIALLYKVIMGALKELDLGIIFHSSCVRSPIVEENGQEGEIPLSEAASCFSPEDNLSPVGACLVKTAEKNIEGSSVFDKLVFDEGHFTCENVNEKGISSVSGREGLEVDSESRCSACNSPEVTKEQELSFDKHLTEYKQEVTSGSEHIVGIPLADNTISEKKLTTISVCSVKLEERDIEGTSAFERLEFDEGHFTYINSRESEVPNISMEPNDHMDNVKSGLGVRALAVEAVAKARATKSPFLMEEGFTFIGDEEDEG